MSSSSRPRCPTLRAADGARLTLVDCRISAASASSHSASSRCSSVTGAVRLLARESVARSRPPRLDDIGIRLNSSANECGINSRMTGATPLRTGARISPMAPGWLAATSRNLCRLRVVGGFHLHWGRLTARTGCEQIPLGRAVGGYKGCPREQP